MARRGSAAGPRGRRPRLFELNHQRAAATLDRLDRPADRGRLDRVPQRSDQLRLPRRQIEVRAAPDGELGGGGAHAEIGADVGGLHGDAHLEVLLRLLPAHAVGQDRRHRPPWAPRTAPTRQEN